jgi:hypothetical protein
MDFEKIGDLIKSAISSGGVYKLALALACAAYWYLADRDIIPFADRAGPANSDIRLSGFSA